MTDQERLAGYVDVWWRAINDFTALLEKIPSEQWSTPTDLAGWDVRAVAAHIAHLEGVLAGNPEETVDVGEPEHVTGLMGLYTEQGVVARSERSPDDLINEIREAATRRHTALVADPRPTGRPSPSRSSAAWAGTGTPCCATAPSTSGCTSRTSAGRSAGPAAWTRRPRSTPLTTCPRAWAWSSPNASAPRPARPSSSTSRAPTRWRSASTSPGAASSWPSHPTSRPSGCRWTASRSSCWPAAGGRPTPARSGSTATTSSGKRIVDTLAVTP